MSVYLISDNNNKNTHTMKNSKIKVGQEFKSLKDKNKELKVLEIDDIGYARVDIRHIGKCIITTFISIDELISEYKLK